MDVEKFTLIFEKQFQENLTLSEVKPKNLRLTIQFRVKYPFLIFLGLNSNRLLSPGVHQIYPKRTFFGQFFITPE